MKTHFLVKLFTVLISSSFGGVYAAQQENFVDESGYVISDSTLSNSNNAAVETVIVAQSTSTDNSNSEEIDSDDAEENEDKVEQYSLPRSSAPVAIDSSLQTTSPIGLNTQTTLSRPEGVKIDSATGFFPSLTIGISNTENPAREEGQDDVNDTVLSIRPSIVYRSAIGNRHPYELGVAASVDTFEELSNLDSDSWTVFGSVNVNISEKLQADIYANHAESNDPRGATATRIIDADGENDEFESDTIGGRLTIGRQSNPLQILLRAEDIQFDYTNNQQDSRDRGVAKVGAGLYWNVGPKTSLFLSIDESDIDYELASQSGFDSTESSTTIGVGWEPSFYTSIVFQIGNLEKDLANPAFEDYDNDTYSGRISWSPTNQSNVGVYASKVTEESTDFNSPFIISDLLGVDFAYSFTDRFRGSLYYNQVDDELVNVREDEIVDFGVGVFYDLARWITFGANWTHTDRSSTDSDAEYESNSYSITATLRPRRAIKFNSLQTGDDLLLGQ